jgi:hypothetical protein
MVNSANLTVNGRSSNNGIESQQELPSRTDSNGIYVEIDAL